MALTPEEESELQELEKSYSSLLSEFEKFKEDLKPKKEIETGLLEAGARGVAQGLTFDTADELTARAESIITGKPYDQALKESRAEYKAAEEKYPITSALGGLTGGIAQGVGLGALTGGTGAAASAAGAASKLGKLKALTRATLLPTAGKSAMKNIGSAALSGAAYSGLSEIGQSEKEGLERLEEVPTALMTGGIVGGTLGAGVEGLKKAGKTVAKAINEAIDEGNVPFSLEKVRDLWRAGKEGQGFITRKSSEAIDTKVEKASRDALATMQNSLDNARTIKKQILDKVDIPIKVDLTVENLINNLDNLAMQNLSDSPKALSRVEGILLGLDVSDTGTVAPKQVNDAIQKLENYLLDNADSSTEVKNVIKSAVNELKTNLRYSVTPEAAQKALLEDPALYEKYKNFVSKTSKDLLKESDILTPEERTFYEMFKSRAGKTRTTPERLEPSLEKYLKGVNKRAKGRPTQQKKVSQLKKDIEILERLKKPLEQEAMVTPLGMLDSTMHQILNASEDLGGVVRGEGTELRRVFKIFDILRQSSAETGTGKKALIKYNEALDKLKKADSKLSNDFEKITKPVMKLIETEKFLQGSKLGEGPRDVSALKQIITAPLVVAGTAGNVLAQATESKAAKSLLRPTVSFLEKKKQQIDNALFADPDNKLLKMVSEGLSDALSSKDEARRAAVLNTLMQYDSIRKLFKEDEIVE